ncbi:MAG: aromatic ring-hydroxylating dioxygenase subunit alpha [Anaerolineae bacterium]|jgi:phenylpropionate dioxygenase-like ring-hydroxylating dioxygenase large terminal subunit
MIPNQWYVLMESKQVKDRPVGVTRMGEKLVFWRDGTGRVSCLRDRCPHRGVELSKGAVVDGHLQCPFHGFEYDASGRAVFIPAQGRNAPVPKVFRAHSYPTYEAEGLVWVWWGDDAPEDLAPPRFFDDIGEGFTYKTVYDPWDAHYSRVIENQLDVVHLPFIHHNTIGRGERTVVDGPVIDWVDEDRFYVYVYNREDDGTPPRKASELPVPHPSGFRLEFIYPNLWQNRISDDVRVVAAFVPVDEAHTLLYLRFYQRFLTVPLLRDLVTWAGMPFNRLIAHQDRRVVETHQPQPSGLRIGEKMISGDRPIVEYRRRREQLIEEART